MTEPAVEWVWHDNLKVLELHIVKGDGTAFDLTGYAVELFGQFRNEAALAINADGTLSDTPIDGRAFFEDLTAITEMWGAATKLISCRAKLTKAAKHGWTRKFDVEVAAPPPEA